MNRQFYELQFEIENACLLDCVHCSSADMRKRGSRSYSDQELFEFISMFQGKTHIYLTGGEPLLYKKLLDLCRKIKLNYNNIDIGLYTTGNCLGGTPISEDVSREMAQAGIVDCYFSIYSDDNNEHDTWTARKGSFSNTLESIRALKNNKISPKAHLVLNKFNQSKITKVINFCQEIGMEEVRILKLTPSGNAQTCWEKIGIPLEEQNKLICELIHKRREFSIRLTFSGYPKLAPCRSWDSAVGCQAGTNLLYIDDEGYVFPCACTKRSPNMFKIGHITELEKMKKYIISKENLVCNETCLNELLP